MSRLYFLFICYLTALTCYAQNSSFPDIAHHLNHADMFQQMFPQEKVYLHFDNTGYFKGERMWFKAYVTKAGQRVAQAGSATTNYAPTDISRVLYVDLLNPSGDVVEQRKLKIDDDGTARGDIGLDSILATGFYEVRAYTRYMLNWGSTGIFSRVFPIFKAPLSVGDYSHPEIDQLSYRRRLPERWFDPDTTAMLSGAEGKPRNAKGYIVNFYPEGGDLVKGLRSRVAVEVLNRDFRHEAVKGLIVDRSGAAVAMMQTGENGRGVFEIQPMTDSLELVLTDTHGRRHRFDLPTVKDEGCVVRMNTIDDVLTTRIEFSDALQGRLMGYAVMNGGNIVQADTLKVVRHVNLELDRHALPAGVNQLTLFSADGQILAERLFFLCPPTLAHDSIGIEVLSPERLSPCCPVKLSLQTQPNAMLSFSAVDAGTMVQGHGVDIRTWMQLLSDIRGYVPHPDYYFESDDREHRLAADTLMLVQGWRRYDWELMTDQKPWVTGLRHLQTIEDGLYVYGRLRRAANRWRKSNRVDGVAVKAFLYNTKGEHLVGETTTDSLGNYAFRLPDLTGEWEMQITTRVASKLKTYTVAIDRRFKPQSRWLERDETQKTASPEANLFVQPDTLGDSDDEFEANGQLVRRTGQRDFATKVVTVKKRRRYFDSSVVTWYDEYSGRRTASLYYDCDDASDEYTDRGEVIPKVYNFLTARNSSFNRWDIPGESPDMFNHGRQFAENAYEGGLIYGGRPIVWIINNRYGGITGAGRMKHFSPLIILKSGIVPNPLHLYIDEVKSIYISEDPNVWEKYVVQSDITAKNPVTIFIYTHPVFSTESKKGRRRTFFQGFNVPSTFEMTDYSIFPPMDDFRRTLYWNPDVRTDKDGRATIEFYNNSTCRKMYLSVEGMTAEGQCLTYQ